MISKNPNLYKVWSWILFMSLILGCVFISGMYVFLPVAEEHYPILLKRVMGEQENYFIPYLVLQGLLLGLFIFKPQSRSAFLDGLLNIKLSYYLFYAGYLILIVNLMDLVIFRRIVFGIGLIPFSIVAFCFYKSLTRNNIKEANVSGIQKKMPGFFILLFMVCLIVPGFYVPPFFNGIGGWTVQMNHNKDLSMSGYQLVREDGEAIWYLDAFFSPVTQIGRFRNAMRKTTPLEKSYPFLYEHYKKVYPVIEQGYLPHEKILGDYAYPTHNLAKNIFDYTRFPPDSITHIRYVSMIKNRKTLDVVSMNIKDTYDVRKNEVQTEAKVKEQSILMILLNKIMALI